MKLPRGSAGTDLSIFIVFIILLGIVWVSTGGPDRPISRSGPFLESPLSEDSSYELPSVDTDTNSEDFITRISRGITNLKAGEEKSPYAEYVSLSVSTAKKESANEEYLTIKTARSLSGTLTISDWRLESSSGTTVPLGFAAPLARLGHVNTLAPVAVGANATVYVVSGRSPVGTSFRLNSCTGYFEQYQDFEPRLPFECPLPIEELQDVTKTIPNYNPSPNCYSALANMRQCEIFTGALPGGVDSTCYNIISNDISYNGCVGRHQADVDFYKNEWRLYLGRDTELWVNKGERIRLVDEAGRVIDAVSY